MKLSLFFLTVVSVPTTMASAYQMGRFDVLGRPYLVSRLGRSRFRNTCSSKGPCAPPPRQYGCTNKYNDCVVDKAFEDLAKEMRDDQNRFARNFAQGFRRGRSSSSSSSVDVDALRQQQEDWVNRAFGLAEDVAKGMAMSPREVKEAKESIRQTKEFVDAVFGIAQEASSGGKYMYTTVRSEVLQDNDQTFQVALDVPGVKADDIDVAVEGAKDKLLVVRGKRDIRGAQKKDNDDPANGSTTKEFRKVFALDSSSVIDKISVVLEDGVLTVTVPRDTAQQVEGTIKIPVTKMDDDLSVGADENQAFELELDLPGVLATNIDVSVQGDPDKTLIITATRQMAEKSKDGGLQTKQMSKRFTIDENVDIDKLTATLSSGVLRVTAPAAAKKSKEDLIRKIDVTLPPESSAAAGEIQVKPADIEDSDKNNEAS